MDRDCKSRFSPSISQTWTDYKLVWDPKEYGGIKSLKLPSSTLWKPDILLFNRSVQQKDESCSADEHFDASFAVNAVVSYTGGISYVPPGIVRVSCDLDLTWFPFDDQVCHLQVGTREAQKLSTARGPTTASRLTST